jgi:F420-non-reducing hydrogenase iron-sulfur subunit
MSFPGRKSKNQTESRVCQRTLEEIGIEPDRAQMYNLSSAQGPRFAEIANEMTEKIKALGPSPVNS